MKPTDLEKEFLKHYKAIRGYAYNLLRDHDDADDLTQEVFRKAFEAKDRYVEGNAKYWLFTITYNTFINIYRYRKKRHDIALRMDEEVIKLDRVVGYDDDPYKGHFSDEVRSAINSLPEEDRNMVFLVYVHGFKYEEIKELTGLPLGTVKTRLFRSRNVMAKEIKKIRRSRIKQVRF